MKSAIKRSDEGVQAARGLPCPLACLLVGVLTACACAAPATMLLEVDWETEPTYDWDYASPWGTEHATWDRPPLGADGGHCLRAATRDGDGEDSRGFLVSGMSARNNRLIEISILMACPSGSFLPYYMETAYWAYETVPETPGEDYHADGFEEMPWEIVQRFDAVFWPQTGYQDGNGDVWQEYTAHITWDGTYDVLAIGFKSGSVDDEGAPAMRWDRLRVEDIGIGPTNTPKVPQETNTPTLTHTPSNTPTHTPTFEEDPTVTPTFTQTPTATITPTLADGEDTPTHTYSPTPTHTSDVVATVTHTFTFTPTPTYTPTVDDDATVTPTHTPTNTPTHTDTPTITYTFSPTFTPTATYTFTHTRTHTPTHTHTFTHTDTPTETPTGCVPPADAFKINPDGITGLTPDLAVDGLGRTHIVWRAGLGAAPLWYARLNADGQIDVAPKLIFSQGVSVPRIAADAAGQAHIITWRPTATEFLAYIRVDANGDFAFSRAFRMHALNEGNSKYAWPSIAIDPVTQRPVVVSELEVMWESSDPDNPFGGQRTYRNSITAVHMDDAGDAVSGTHWDAVRYYGTTPFAGARRPSIAIDHTGRGHVTWWLQQSGNHIAYDREGGDPESFLYLSSPGDSVASNTGPRISFGNGQLQVAWADTTLGIVSQTISTGGNLGPYDSEIAPNASFASGPAVADGDITVFAWQDQRDGINNVYTRPMDQTARERQLSCDGGSNVNVAALGPGHFVYVWQVGGGTTADAYVLLADYREPTPTPTDTPTATATFTPCLRDEATCTPTHTFTPTNTPKLGVIKGVTIKFDLRGEADGPHSGVSIALNGAQRTTTDGAGRFLIADLEAGTYVVTAAKEDYETATATVLVQDENEITLLLEMHPEDLDGPKIFNFDSPDGVHFIQGLPGSFTFECYVRWNDDGQQLESRSVVFDIAGQEKTPTKAEVLHEQLTKFTLVTTVPPLILECEQMEIRAVNSLGKDASQRPYVFFHPVPAYFFLFAGNVPPPIIPWLYNHSQGKYRYNLDEEVDLWDIQDPVNELVSSKAGYSLGEELTYDTKSGTISAGLKGSGSFGFSVKMPGSSLKTVSDTSVSLAGTLDVLFRECGDPLNTPGWKVGLAGKNGVVGPAVELLPFLYPPAAPAVRAAANNRFIGRLVKVVEVGAFLVASAELSGQYPGGQWTPGSFLGAKDITFAGMLGLEGSGKIEAWGGEGGVVLGLGVGPEIKLAPTLAFSKLTFKGAASIYGKYKRWKYAYPIEMEWSMGPGALVLVRMTPMGDWEAVGWVPVGPDFLDFGPGYVLSSSRDAVVLTDDQNLSTGSLEEVVLTNVDSLSLPHLIVHNGEVILLFARWDETKPPDAPTEISVARQVGEEPWQMIDVTDDERVDYFPRGEVLYDGDTMAVWERVVDPIPAAEDMTQELERTEIAWSRYNRGSQQWSPVQVLTDNNVLDRNPELVRFGQRAGVVWIQNEGAEVLGVVGAGDRLMYAEWSGDNWLPAQTLATMPNRGIAHFTFVADGNGEGHLVLVVDEDGDIETTDDMELHWLSTSNGVWSAPVQLTFDDLEDDMPVLVAPNGVPRLIWLRDGVLVDSDVQTLMPRPLLDEGEPLAPLYNLAATTVPGGAVLAFSAQANAGANLTMMRYDKQSDSWTTPRRLTQDEATTSGISVAYDHQQQEVVFSYLKSSLVREDVEIDFEDQEEPTEQNLLSDFGRIDICVLRHGLGWDIAVPADLIRFSPSAPAPGDTVTVTAVVENVGEYPVTDLQVAFHEGDPLAGAEMIGELLEITGELPAGATAEVEVEWTIPAGQGVHRIFVVADPFHDVNDRVRANNVAGKAATAPDLQATSLSARPVSEGLRALTGVVRNIGTAPAGAFEVALRAHDPEGDAIHSELVPGLVPNATFEFLHLWDTGAEPFIVPSLPVYMVVDPNVDVPEDRDRENNTSAVGVDVFNYVTPTPTDTPTQTPTPSNTPTVTHTPSNTATVTPVPTDIDTPVATATFTHTHTSAMPPTSTPSATFTDTPIPTSTPTPPDDTSPTPTPIPGDWNEDGKVDHKDLVGLLQAPRQEQGEPRFTWDDIFELSRNWRRGQ